MELTLTPEARGAFLGFSACFGAQANVLREEDESAAPRMGTAVWHLGMLACSHLALDLATDEAPKLSRND